MMIGYLLYLIMIVIIILLIIKINDERRIFKIFGLVGISIGVSLFLIGYILKVMIEKRVNFINISKISELIFNKFFMIGFIIILIGGLCLLMWKIVSIIYDKKMIEKKS